MLNQRVCLPYGKIPQIPAILNSSPGLPSRQVGFARGRPRFAPLTVHRYSALSGRGGKKGCGLKLRDTWSVVYCLGNQAVDQSILEKLRVPVFLRSWKYWCNLYRLWCVVIISRLSGDLQGYKNVK